ncbi:MAG TPA: hypothetical protein VJK90_18070 [Acetobacteraceae bacterium]|jgi:hypothetical protein|nr:hypothetical protein [Acetobacteraceae bacterium]
MTEITIQGPPLALDPATRSTLLQTIVDCLPHTPSASDAERTAQRESAFALLTRLAPTDPVEAMLAAQIVAAQYASMNAYRQGARSDLPHDLQLRYQSKGESLSRLTSSKRRELVRHQASQPRLPAGFAAAHAAQAQATAPTVPARPAAPAPRPQAAAAQRPATPAPAAAPPARAAAPAHAAIDQFLAKAAAASHPADGDPAPPTEAEFAQFVADAQTLLAEITPPARDTGALLQAEIAARAAATQLAA